MARATMAWARAARAAKATRETRATRATTAMATTWTIVAAGSTSWQGR